MKGKFDAYVLWPLAKRIQNWIVDKSPAWDFTLVVPWNSTTGIAIILSKLMAEIEIRITVKSRAVDWSIIKFWTLLTVHKHQISPSWTVWKSLNVLLIKTVYSSRLNGMYYVHVKLQNIVETKVKVAEMS